MKALWTILEVWRPQGKRLLAGLALAELSVLAALLLMGQTGARLGAAALGMAGGFMLLRGAGAGRIVLRYFERLATHDAMFRALADLRLWFYRRLARGSAAGLGFRRSGDLLTRLVLDVQSLDGLYLRVLVPFASALLTVPVVIWICGRFSFLLAISVGIIFLCMVVGLPFLAARLSRAGEAESLEKRGLLQADALDLAQGLREARLFSAQDRLSARLTKQQESLYAVQAREERRLSVLQAGSRFLARAGVVAVLAVSAGLLGAPPEAVAGITVLFVVTTSLNGVVDLPRAGCLGGQALSAAERIVTAADLPAATPQGDRPAPKGYELIFDHVAFGWRKESPVFENVSMRLKEGTRSALIGPSGAGKSSLAALALKVVSPWKGVITLGGVELEAIEDEELRQKIGWLSQNSHLFDDTIRNNLLLGREDVPEEALWKALHQAQLADFVCGLPEGLETVIGENGSRLSGGQGRRLALARVLLSPASLLILDEPASGLDAETEQAFLKTLNDLDDQLERRTVLLIVHRLTGVENLDQAFRLEDGRLQVIPQKSLS